MRKTRLAVVLFNLGGPDRPEAIRPFLVNLFKDPAILRVPPFVRVWLARVIAWKRVRPATENYALMGGRSPLLGLTREQADRLEAALTGLSPDTETKTFIAMRYWHPFSGATVAEVRAWDPDRILLLPLYPQYSTTTTGSSLTAWREEAARQGLAVPTTALCCYPVDPAFITAGAAQLRAAYDAARDVLPADIGLRILFSAHGLPETIVKRGDPYQSQIERTAAALVTALAIPGLDHVVCYQSRATPQKWLEPSTDAEVERAGHDKVALLVVPLAFVSDHSETLVELDVEYRDLAIKHGVPGYFRAPVQNADPGFIDALAGLALAAVARGPGLCSAVGRGTCPKTHRDCPHVKAA